MRNGKHYVPVRMTKAEKENFLRLSKLCNAPEKTVLYWLVNDMIVYEKPPETFFKISNLMRRLETNFTKDYSQKHTTVKTVNNNIERQ